MPRRPDWKYGPIMLVLSAGLAVQTSRGGPWLLFGWPSASFLLVSIAYFTDSVSLFGKRTDGTRSGIASLLMGPYLAFVYAVWRLQIAFLHEAAMHEVNERLIVARRLRLHEYPEEPIQIVDLTCEMCDPAPIRSRAKYRCFPILDAGAPQPAALAELIRSLQIDPGARLLIHCANGHGRTGTVAAAWLVASGSVTSVAEALATLQTVRPEMKLRRSQLESLEMAIELLAADETPEA